MELSIQLLRATTLLTIAAVTPVSDSIQTIEYFVGYNWLDSNYVLYRYL